MTLPNPVPDDSAVTVTTTSPIRHLCPHRDETDRGHITITWEIHGQTIELHSLAEYLKSWDHSRISHEQLTDRIRHDLSTLPDVHLVGVETTWQTAGIEVTCSTQPILVDRP